jgi:DNA-binding NarL/FixJ family response regulator
MDIHMPQLDGLAALRLIKAELRDTRIVMLTMSAEDEDLFEAIKSGACGYLLKTQDTDEFFALLQDVARGEVALSPGLAARILQEFGRQAGTALAVEDKAQRGSLSAREIEVLTLVARGLTYKEVGAKLCLAERTVKYHMGEIIARLHLENRAQVVEYARRVGLVRWL